MEQPSIIKGEIFTDHRGKLASLNAFHMEGVERIYFITHPETSTVRGWHGHRFERKWFHCVKGSFTLGLVAPDDWDNPSPDLPTHILHLSDRESELVCVPAGYANAIKAAEPDSILLVLSDKILEVAELDSWRYDKEMWVDWSQY